MENEKHFIVTLLEKRQQLRKELFDTNNIINSIEGYDSLIDEWSNEQITQSDLFPIKGDLEDKILFSLEKLVRASKKDIILYMGIIDSSLLQTDTHLIEEIVDKMFVKGILNASIHNGIQLFSRINDFKIN